MAKFLNLRIEVNERVFKNAQIASRKFNRDLEYLIIQQLVKPEIHWELTFEPDGSDVSKISKSMVKCDF